MLTDTSHFLILAQSFSLLRRPPELFKDPRTGTGGLRSIPGTI